ncbi:hypothetical protein JXB31_05095 [Candidatus Woesearchaeota archaeon]|nr:hypothetical protein [Candidatus Woesearchaeota archaeon]
MIIIVILALVFLGIAITFIFKLIPDEIPTVPNICELYPPTSDSPVCVNEEYELSRGKTIKMNVAFYNDEADDIDDSVLPEIVCNPSIDGNDLELKTSSSGKLLEVSEYEDYLVIVNAPKDAARGTYPCNLRLSNTQESFAIIIK